MKLNISAWNNIKPRNTANTEITANPQYSVVDDISSSVFSGSYVLIFDIL